MTPLRPLIASLAVALLYVGSTNAEELECDGGQTSCPGPILLYDVCGDGEGESPTIATSMARQEIVTKLNMIPGMPLCPTACPNPPAVGCKTQVSYRVDLTTTDPHQTGAQEYINQICLVAGARPIISCGPCALVDPEQP